MVVLVRHFAYVGNCYYVRKDENKKLFVYNSDKSKAHKFNSTKEAVDFAVLNGIEDYVVEGGDQE